MSNPPLTPLVVAPLRFMHRGTFVQLENVPPDRTLLDLLREDLRLTATKEGCAAGDCGACTVVVAEVTDDVQRLQWRAINSCIKPAHAIDGLALWTADDLAQPDGTLHPVQQAWLDLRVPQCGYCQSGQIMGAVALLRATPRPSDAQIDAAMSGHLCRCGTQQRVRKAVHALAASGAGR